MGPEIRKCRGKSTCSGYGNAYLCRVRHLLRRRDRREGVLFEPGADVGEQLDLFDGGVGLAHALVAQPKLLAAAACRSRRRELQVVRGRHCGRGGR
eukprot:scaffold32362_cov50-Phaeocystis_antarctica.AAC.2